MLSYNSLGSMGHLGNQMFQYACLVATADRHGVSATCPQSSKFTHYHTSKSRIADCFELGYAEDDYGGPTYLFREDGFLYDSKINDLSLEGKHVDLLGYFQSDKYFNDKEDLIRKQYTFKEDIIKSSKNLGVDPTDKVAIHFRRGDYLGLQDTHPVPDKLYYSEAMSHFPDSEFLIFSDDIEWCIRCDLFYGGKDRGFHFSRGKQYEDLCLMSQCKGHIIANSSYSWWGSWLSENSEKTVAPKKWFGPKGPPEWQDVYRDGWVVI